MKGVAIPNLVTDRKARVGVSVLGIAIGLIVLLATGSPGISALVMGGIAILISGTRYRQERAARSQISSGQSPESN